MRSSCPATQKPRSPPRRAGTGRSDQGADRHLGGDNLMRNRLFVLLAATVFVASACTGTASSAAPTTAPGETTAPAGSTAPESLPLRFSIGGEPTYFSNSADDHNTAYVYTL